MAGYIRVEGVNIYANLGDTDQLSVVRGGSYFFKQAIMDLVPDSSKKSESTTPNTAYDFSGALECISQGASVGLFRTRQQDITEPELEQLCQRIQAAVNQHRDFRHLTFTLTHTLKSPDEDFIEVEKRLTALSRFQQLAQLTIAPDPISTTDVEPCDINGIRAGFTHLSSEELYLPKNGKEENNKQVLSESVVARFNAGIRNRRSLLPLGEDSDYTLTRNIEDLGNNPSQGNLNHKIALIYFDGNGFGDFRNRFIKCTDDHEGNYQTFDQTMRDAREQLLQGWVDHVSSALSQANSSEDNGTVFKRYYMEQEYGRVMEHQLRFEPLLWGGDELLFVLPAWLGFEFLQFFYQATQDWGEAFGNAPLSHAGGMVFCKANTPIFRVRGIASELAEAVKEHQCGGRAGNYYDLMALESVDFPAESLESYRDKTYGTALMKARTPLPANNANQLTRLAAKLDGIPKSQIYQLCLPAQKQDMKALNVGIQRLASLINTESYESLRESLESCFGSKAIESGWCWIWLREYWDYLEPLAAHNTAPHTEANSEQEPRHA